MNLRLLALAFLCLSMRILTTSAIAETEAEQRNLLLNAQQRQWSLASAFPSHTLNQRALNELSISKNSKEMIKKAVKKIEQLWETQERELGDLETTNVPFEDFCARSAKDCKALETELGSDIFLRLTPEENAKVSDALLKRGIDYFLSPIVYEHLSIAPKRIARIESLLSKLRADFKALPQKVRKSLADKDDVQRYQQTLRQSASDLQNESTTRVLANLTDDQLEAYLGQMDPKSSLDEFQRKMSPTSARYFKEERALWQE